MSFISFSSRAASPTAVKKPCSSKVVMLDGTLREFARCTTVHDVMTDDGDESDDCIVFDTDKLGVGECISPLKPDDTLVSGHTYMLLPRSMLHRRLDSVDTESLSTKVKEAVLMADLEEKLDKSRSFCGLRGMLLSVSGHDQIGKKTNCRQEKNLKKEVDHDVKMKKKEQIGKMSKTDESADRVLDDEGKKVGKNEYVWYLGFASLPVEEEDD